MADIVIRGIEMPKSGYVELLLKVQDREVYYNCMGEKKIHVADVTEVARGQWKTRKNWSRCVCSVCSWESGNSYNFCPNCGADMRVVSDNG